MRNRENKEERKEFLGHEENNFFIKKKEKTEHRN